MDDQVAAFAESLSRDGALDVYILCDETLGAVETGGLPKISVTPQTLRSLGLYDEVKNLLWRCGDYGFYVARQQLPHYDAFWMVEPDVRLNDSPPSEILARFPGPEAADFLAGWLRPGKPGWGWSKRMDPAEGRIWRCLFCLVRLSAPALDALLEARRSAAEDHRRRRRDPDRWPNDEVFVASTLMRQGFSCRDFNEFGLIYDEAWFGFWKPHTQGEVEAEGRRGLICHPVLGGSRYFHKLSRWAIKRGQMDELERIVDRLVGVEWTEAEAEEHRGSFEALRTEAATRRRGSEAGN